MAFLKGFLFQHGEKLLLTVVAVFAIWSIVGNLLGGGSNDIKPGQIEENIDKIKNHIKSTKVQSEKKEILRSTAIVQNILKAYKKNSSLIDGWQSFYIMPPKPQKFTTRPSDNNIYIPEEKYLPRISYPQDLRVEVGGKRVVLIFRENDKARWLAGVRAKVYRKAVGDGKNEADYKAVHRKQLERAGYEAVKTSTSEVLPKDSVQPADMFASVKNNKDRMITKNEESVEQEVSEIEKEKTLFEEREVTAKSDLEDLLNASSLYKSGWELVADNIKPVTQKPDIEMLLKGEPVDYEEADNLPTEESSPKWFYFVDDYQKGGLVENVVYRYMVVLSAKAANVPDEVLIKEKEGKDNLKNYKSFVTNGNERLALTEKEFKLFHFGKSDDGTILTESTKTKGSEAVYPTFIKLKPQPVHDISQNRDEAVTRLWLDEEMREKISQIDKDVTYYSQVSYSNYFLTPVRTRYKFTSKFGEDTAMIKVYIINDEGEEISANFTVKKPVLPPISLKPSRNPYKKYPLDKIKPTPIGGEKKVKGIIYDFSTGWGLVDIKNCEMIVKPYKLVTKKHENGKPVIVNGEEVKEKKYNPSINLGSSYMVIVELKSKFKNKKPRFLRIPKYRKSSMLEDVEYIWNPKKEK